MADTVVMEVMEVMAGTEDMVATAVMAGTGDMVVARTNRTRQVCDGRPTGSARLGRCHVFAGHANRTA